MDSWEQEAGKEGIGEVGVRVWRGGEGDLVLDQVPKAAQWPPAPTPHTHSHTH